MHFINFFVNTGCLHLYKFFGAVLIHDTALLGNKLLPMAPVLNPTQVRMWLHADHPGDDKLKANTTLIKIL